jgi:hypothetical protein
MSRLHERYTDHNFKFKSISSPFLLRFTVSCKTYITVDLTGHGLGTLRNFYGQESIQALFLLFHYSTSNCFDLMPMNINKHIRFLRPSLQRPKWRIYFHPWDYYFMWALRGWKPGFLKQNTHYPSHWCNVIMCGASLKYTESLKMKHPLQNC